MRRRLSRIVFALAVVSTALFAHVAIDVAGDFLLARDAYDDVAHHSREGIFTVVVALALLALWRALQTARADLAGSRGSLRALLRDAVPTSCARFVATVGACSLPALIAMATLDGVIDGRSIDDAQDLLGGSVGLGLTCIAASALLVASVLWHVVRAVARFERVVLRLVAILAQRARHASVGHRARVDRRPCTRTAGNVCARSFGLRAPPASA